jgi:regulatory protein
MTRRRDPDGGTDTRNAYDRALGMLARREYSQRELRTRLERAGCDEAESQAAIAQLQGQHYQDDQRFGEMLVRTRVGQGYGPARIRVELRSHALTDAAIQALLDAAAVDWIDLARAQLRKKYGARRTMASRPSAPRSCCVADLPPKPLDLSPIPSLAAPALDSLP